MLYIIGLDALKKENKLSVVDQTNKRKSAVLKIALFATGISGIVAEYVLSTLASYFIGNAVVQFALIVSTMLFAMGFGSRLSKLIEKELLVKFIYLELILSFLVSFCALAVYITYGRYSPVFIYALSIVVGLLIGLEIPLVTRLNEEFEELKVNVASVLEKDYYGSLVGGLFFAFVGMPFLGLTYTPFVLGLLNFTVALFTFLYLRKVISEKYRKILTVWFMVVGVVIFVGLYFAKPIVLYGDQKKYRDKIVFQTETQYQKIVMTQWQDNYSLFINGNLQLSSFDEYMYHEPLVHPVVNVVENKKRVLVLGGGDGCAVRELLNYKDIEEITLVDLDPKMTELAKENELFLEMNKGALNHQKVTIKHEDAFQFLEHNKILYDVIIIDLPDPNNVDLNKLYTREFYFLCSQRLTKSGAIITQAGSPYYASKAFYCVEKSMRAGGFNTLPLHSQILTMGEWGWIMGSKQYSSTALKQKMINFDYDKLDLEWLNNDASKAITLFGKPMVDTTNTAVNTLFNPVLYTYYKKGNWKIY
jgi:spermidine synthase